MAYSNLADPWTEWIGAFDWRKARRMVDQVPVMELVSDGEHFRRIVQEGICRARVSIDIMTADFKAMLVPDGSRRRAKSIIEIFRNLADKGVEIRILHAGVPSSAALIELKQQLPERLSIRRCPRLHSKAVVIDAAGAYFGSANLTGAGLGAKADGRRNFELGVWTTSIETIDRIMNEFNLLWEGQHCETCKRREICPEPLEEPKLMPVTPRAGPFPSASSRRPDAPE